MAKDEIIEDEVLEEKAEDEVTEDTVIEEKLEKEESKFGNNVIYPIKVRLVKHNPTNQTKVMFNDVALYTYKDTVIEDVETLMKIQPMQKYLIVKAEIKESKEETSE